MQNFNDLGFGAKINSKNRRLINPDGSFDVRRVGIGLRDIHPYQFLITIPWWKFFLAIVAIYLSINCIFALLYVMVGMESLSNSPVDGTFGEQFSHSFFFSAQTLTTVGYGATAPQGLWSNVIAVFEAMTGIMLFAIATGILYGRFSRPSARIAYSHHALIAPYKEGKAFMFRIVNRRKNQLIELEAQVTLMWYEMIGGEEKQRYFGLPLERKSVTLFPLNWTLVHPIDASSPLWGVSAAELEARHAQVLITIRAYDDTFAQMVHSRYSYKYTEIIENAKFTPMYYPDPEGRILLELDKVGDYERVNSEKPDA
ncbi:MAG: transporter [Bacteroidetes bacterium]|nr:MAG: transporter [Bacteroidota bacterium]